MVLEHASAEVLAQQLSVYRSSRFKDGRMHVADGVVPAGLDANLHLLCTSHPASSTPSRFTGKKQCIPNGKPRLSPLYHACPSTWPHGFCTFKSSLACRAMTGIEA